MKNNEKILITGIIILIVGVIVTAFFFSSAMTDPTPTAGKGRMVSPPPGYSMDNIWAGFDPERSFHSSQINTGYL